MELRCASLVCMQPLCTNGDLEQREMWPHLDPWQHLWLCKECYRYTDYYRHITRPPDNKKREKGVGRNGNGDTDGHDQEDS